MTKPRESYIIFKGDEIVKECRTLEEANAVFDSLPPRKRLLDGRAIYKLVREDDNKPR
jgi:hypothetical protein